MTTEQKHAAEGKVGAHLRHRVLLLVIMMGMSATLAGSN